MKAAKVEPIRQPVSKSLCRKALRYLFGETAYFQTLRDDKGLEVGLRVVALHHGKTVEIGKATLNPGQPAGRNDPELPLALLKEAAKAVGAVVSIKWEGRHPSIHVQQPIERQVPVDMTDEAAADKTGRIRPVVEAVLCKALTSCNLPINAPICKGCEGCGTGDVQPCRAWAVWARQQLDAKRDETPAEALAQARGETSPTVPA